MLPLRHLLGAAFSLLALASVTLHAAEPALLWDGLNADLFSDDDGPFTIGFQFRTQTDIRVTALGAFDHLGDGFIDAHAAGIWTVGNESPLITANIPGPCTWMLLVLGGGLLATACLRSRPQDTQSGQ
jgi:hypothetical protein